MGSAPVELAAPDGRAAAVRPEIPPLALYVHIPWCARKCPYCDFNSHVAKGSFPEEDYCAALVADLEAELPRVWGRRVGSVYFGGGTPSLFSARSIDRLLSEFRARIPIAPGAEVTLEANPGTLEDGKAAALRDAGVNRLSIGAQSFSDELLARIGRIHGAAQARGAVEQAVRDVGNVNVDVMYALPGQDLAGALDDAREAMGLGPAHVSAYCLTIEEGTAFARRPPPMPTHDAQADMADAVADALEEGGYPRYEVSAYAPPGRECAHNINYWSYGDYLGIGCGAHGKVTVRDRIERTEKVRSPASYVRRCLEGEEAGRAWDVSPAERVFEYALNAFRLRKGFDPASMARRCGIGFAEAMDLLGEALRRGLAEDAGGLVRATQTGWDHMNDLVALFAPGDE